MKKKKSPLLAGILNFLFLGVGYLYLGKRKIFGWLMTAAFIVMSIEFLLGDLSHLGNLINTHTPSLTLIAIAVGIDGYLMGEEVNGKRL